MRQVEVTYTLTSLQEEKLDNIRKHLKHQDIEQTMQHIMELGSLQYINQKIAEFEEFYGLAED